MLAEARELPIVGTSRLPIYGLLVGNAVSQIGNVMTMVALPWFVLETTGSAAQTGLVGFFVALPAFLSGLFGGTLVDRVGYKRVNIVSELFSGFGIVMIPLLYLTVGLAFWQLLALVFIGALLDVPGVTARRSMLPELTKHGGLQLEQVNSAFEGIQYVSILLGPPLAGLLIAWLGASNVLWLDAGTFAISAALVAATIPGRLAGAPTRVMERYVDELKAGLRFLRDDSLLLSLAISLAVINFVSSSVFAVVLPVYVKQTFDRATVLGLIVAAFGAGALVGVFVYGAIGHRLPRRSLWIAGFVAEGLWFWALLLTSSVPIIMACIFFAAVIAGPLNALLVTIRHERIPRELRGRVFSTFSAISAVASPLGILLAGFMLEYAGLDATLITIATLSLLIAIGMFFVPAFRRMDESREQAVYA